MQSEFDFIKRIRDQAAKSQAPDLVLGIGDDAAILREREGRETLITVDLLVEDVDFKLEYAPPHWLGHKALAVSLSDIAAMGGEPKFSLLTLGIPKHNPGSDEFWKQFFEGYFALTRKHEVALVGGDISSTPDRLTIDSVVIGHCQAGKAIRRGSAKIGDAIYLTSSIGASAAGLKLLSDGVRVNENEESLAQSALRAHLRPEPRVEFGRRIGESGLAHAMIDVSDGLVQDLGRICEESKAAAIIEFDSAPIAGEVSLVCNEPETAFELAVGGGEDFELLLTANKDDEAKLVETAVVCDLRLTRIGAIVPANYGRQSSSVLLSRNGVIKPLSIRGFDHFPV